MLNITSAKLTGTPTDSGWAQVYEFEPSEPAGVKERGHFFAVVAVKDGETGRNIIANLHRSYFGELTLRPFNAIKSAVEKAVKESGEETGGIEIAACALVGDVVYSAAYGGGEVTISREGSLGTILKSSAEVVSASGYPKSGDTILLATKSFSEHISQEAAKEGLTSGNPETAVALFAPAVHGNGDAGGLGAVVIKFDEAAFSREIAPPVSGGSIIRTPQSVVRSLKRKFENVLILFSKRFPERRIYVKPPAGEEVTSQNKKLTFSVAIALLAILVVSIGFGIRQKRVNDVKKNYESILSSIKHDIDEAISLASVSPEKSRELFFEGEQKLVQIEGMKVKDIEISELRKKIDDSRAAILGEYRLSPELFLDLTLLSSGFKADTVSLSGGTIFALDGSGKKIVSVAVSTKKSKVVAGPNILDEAFDLASYEDRSFILASDGVYELDNGKTKVVDKVWEGEAKIAAFAANLYVLDKSANTIYRFAGSGSTFGDKQNWLAAGTKADFSDAKQWVIDGSVYVLFPNPRIFKFSLGSPQNFSVSGVFPEIGTIDAIYAGADNQDVYLLDRAGKRVVVVDKKGAYKAQYLGDEIANAANLIVSEADKKIILTTGDKLLSIELKHL